MAKFVQEHHWIDQDAHICIIKTSASKSWYLQYNEPGRGKGRQRRQSLKTTSLKQARIQATRFTNAYIAGSVSARRSHLVTLTEVASQRLERLSQTRTAGTVKAFIIYYRTLAAVLPVSERTPVILLTTAVLEKVEKRIREGGFLVPSANASEPPRRAAARSPKGVRELMKACRGLIRFALQRQLIDKDPATAYALPKGESREVEVFTASEIRMLFEDPSPGMADIWKFMTYTAVRIDEFCWLTKEDVICNDNGIPVSIRIRKKSFADTGETWSPKAGHHRIIPLLAGATEIVKLKLESTESIWLFDSPASWKHLPGRWLSDRLRARFAARLKICGIGHGTPHVMRHTFASFLAKTMSLPVLQRFLGHNDIQTTMRYVHIDVADIAQALQDCDLRRLTKTTAEPPLAQIIIQSDINKTTSDTDADSDTKLNVLNAPPTLPRSAA